MFPQYHAAVNVSNVSNVSNVWCCRSSYVQDSSEDDGLVRPAHSHHSTPSHRSSLWCWWWWRWWQGWRCVDHHHRGDDVDDDNDHHNCNWQWSYKMSMQILILPCRKSTRSTKGGVKSSGESSRWVLLSYDLRSDVKPLFLIWYPISALTGYLIMAQSQVSRLRDRWQSRLLQLQTVKCQQQVSFPSLHIS